MALLEGAWDCSNCLATRILGRHRKCPTCGDPRNPVLTPEEKPYLPRNAKEVTDPDGIASFGHGPDWNCGYCGNANLGNRTVCENCNQPKDFNDTINRRSTYLGGISADGVVFDDIPDESAERIEDELTEATRLIEAGDSPRKINDVILPADSVKQTGDIADRVQQYEALITTKDEPFQWSRFYRRFKLPLFAGAALSLIALIVFGLIALLSTSPQPLVAVEKTWMRQTEVEEFRTLTEEDWAFPSDARVLDSFSALHHYDKVLDGYKTDYYTDYVEEYAGQEPYSYSCGSRTVDNGDGSFSVDTEYCEGSRAVYRTVAVRRSEQVPVYRDVPVYRTKYRFEFDRWVFDKWETLSGTSVNTPTPQWPKPSNLRQDQRVGNGRNETYKVQLRHNETGTIYTEEVNFSIWNSVSVGEAVVGNITRNGSLRSVEWSDVSAG